MIIGAHQHDGIDGTANLLPELIAHVEERKVTNTRIERRVPPRDDEVPEPGRSLLGNHRATPSIGKVKRNKAIIDQIVHSNWSTLRIMQLRVRNSIANT